MSGLPTTGAMVEAAQDAYDVAAADFAVARAKLLTFTALDPDLGLAVARVKIAKASMEYAAAVLDSVQVDRAVSA